MAAEKNNSANGGTSVKTGSKVITMVTGVYEDEDARESKPWAMLCSKRWILAYLCFCTSSLVFALRQSLSVALVCMDTKDLARMASHNLTLNLSSHTSFANVSTLEVQPYIPEKFRGVFLSCLYFGSLPASLAAAALVHRFGSKRVTAFSLAASGAMSVLLPPAIRASLPLAFLVRTLQGLFSGVIPTTNQVFWAFWAPASEKAQLVSLASQGGNLGIITGSALSGVLCDVPVDDGWPLVFYLYGSFSLLLLLVWLPCVYDTPTAHPRIQQRELVYIRRGSSVSAYLSQKEKFPWRAFLTSGPVWAVLVSQMCHVWVMIFVITYLPMYMNDVLKYNIAENGLLTSVPFVGRLLGSLVFAYLSDFCSQNKRLPLRANRIIFHCIGTLSTSAGFVALSFLGEQDRVLANVILIALVTLQSATQGSFRVSHLDIAPRYAGSILSVSFTLGSVASLLVPTATSAMTQQGTQAEWQRVFLLNAAVSLFNFLFFSFCSSASEQAWAIPPEARPAGLQGTGVVQVTPEILTAVVDTAKPSGAAAVDAGSRPFAIVSSDYSSEEKREDMDECVETNVDKDKPVPLQIPITGGQVNEGFENDTFQLQPSSEENGGVYNTRL